MNQNKILSLLGIAARGRNVVSGEYQSESAVKDGSAMLVIVAEDASANTKKLFSNKCSFYEVPFYQYETKENLGRAVGKNFRSSLAVTNAGLADSIIRQLESAAHAEERGRSYDGNGGKHGENEST